VPEPDVIREMSGHFAPTDLRARVEQALASAGRNSRNTTIDGLASFDQLHIEGLAATRRLAELAGITQHDIVLDAACGLAGASRYLAQTFGCTVHGIDLTEALLKTAELLNGLTGLSEKVLLRRADVTDMPFRSGSFDVVWTQHAAQSIPDKPRFFAELHRVLKPGGRGVIHDLYRGPGDPIHFPSFCGTESIVFLISDREMRRLLEAAEFEVTHWADLTAAARAANSAISLDHAAPSADQNTIAGLDRSLLGANRLVEMAENSVKDFDVGSVGVFEALLRKAG